MTRHQVLVIEDDEAIRVGLSDALRSEGYGVVEAADGHEGQAAISGAAYDLLLLDLVLPGRDGFDLLKSVRKTRPSTPVIILTARGEESDRVRGLQMGADDYVVKPFSVRELLARVEAVLRRAPAADPKQDVRIPGGTARLADLRVEFDDGTTADLSDKEAALLRYLATQSGKTVSRDEILARVWGVNPKGIETRTVDMHVARIREKIRDTGDAPGVIETVRGKGYVFHAAPKR